MADKIGIGKKKKPFPKVSASISLPIAEKASLAIEETKQEQPAVKQKAPAKHYGPKKKRTSPAKSNPKTHRRG